MRSSSQHPRRAVRRPDCRPGRRSTTLRLAMTTREDSMPQAQLFRLEAEVRCTDGDCGKLRTLVISRGDDAVTHLVVEPAHREGPGRIAPLGLVDTGGADTGGAGKGELRLRCTRDEFERL